MSITNEVVLWYLNGCVASLYSPQRDAVTGKRVPKDTVSFTNKAYLAYKQVNSLRIATAAVPFLGNLSSLQLQNNCLSNLPKELWRLTSLTELNLGYNQLKEVPIEIGLLTELRELYLHNNEITTLPSQINRLVHLEILDLTGNKLTRLPGELLRLDLKHLWIDHNQFQPHQEKPTCFLSLKSLCAQTTGLLCLEDEDSRKVIQDLPSFQQERLLPAYQNVHLIPACFLCSTLLFHHDLQVVKDDKIPLVFNACSQNCYIKLLGGDPL